MSSRIACIAGDEIYRQWEAARLTGEKLGPQNTPFGPSGDIFSVETDGESFYLLSRYAPGLAKTAPAGINDRANMYALKDLGVQCVLGWGPGGAITHNFAVGDLVILNDLVDFTHLREKTFFEDSPLGYLRQFPVFCPSMRRTLGEVLHDMKLVYHGSGTAAVREGPRLETPAEVRMLATIGAEIVTHLFAAEVSLAKELQLCYASVCYVANYAETGSRHRPFATGDLFGGLAKKSDAERLESVAGTMGQIVSNLSAAIEDPPRICECSQTMAAHKTQYDLPDDWREWMS